MFQAISVPSSPGVFVNETYYSVKQIADKLSVSHQTIHNLIKAGKLEALRIGHSVRITESALQKFLASATQKDGRDQ